jgi:phage FluMu protein Com
MLKEIRCKKCHRILCKVDTDGTVHIKTGKDGLLEVITCLYFGKINLICNSHYSNGKRLEKPCGTTESLEYAA